jgi:hypothetical protein
MTNQILEWAPFRLRPGVDEAELLQISEQLQRDFLLRQPGFLRRELIKGSERGYVDLVWWDSFASAQAAAKQAAESRACKAYLALMDVHHGDPNDSVLLYDIVGAYGAGRTRATDALAKAVPVALCFV